MLGNTNKAGSNHPIVFIRYRDWDIKASIGKGYEDGVDPLFMHARLWEQPNLKNRTLLSTVGLHTAPLDPVLSPRLVVESNRRKSWICEPIYEEPSLQEGTVHLETTEYQRQHKHRKSLIRTQSAPLLISTTTTAPIYIKYVSLVLFHPLLTLSTALVPSS